MEKCRTAGIDIRDLFKGSPMAVDFPFPIELLLNAAVSYTEFVIAYLA